MKNLLKYILLTCLLLYGLSAWKYNQLPNPDQINPYLAQAPIVKFTTTQPFTATMGKTEYLIEPIREYELYGLVVSKHNARGWQGQIHKEAGDYINVADLCVTWGSNATQGYYQDASFSSAQFTCYVYPSSSNSKFIKTLLTNNHMLSDDKQIIRQLHKIRIGDQIYIKGYLANYSKILGNQKQLQKLRDTDLIIGDRKCETVYATQVQVLKKNRNIWQYLYWITLVGIVGSIIGWFCIPSKYFFND